MRKRLIILILALVLSVVLANATPVSDTYSYLEKLTEYDTKTPNAIETNHFWDMARQIESFGQDALLVIGEGLKSPRVNIRIAAARISYKLGRKSDAITALLNVIGDDKEPAAAAIAGEVLGNLFRDDPSAPDKKATADKIRDMLETSVSPYQRLALLRLLFRTGGDTRVVKEIKDMVAQGSSEMRLAAALTLAEMERFEDCLEILKPLSSDPTETGRLAALFVRYYELLKAYERKESGGARPKTEFDYRLLDEIMAIIKERYVDTAKVDAAGMKNLLNAAAHGIAGALDKFSGYQDEKEKQKSQESLNMRYGGIGAYVSMRDEFLTIERPIYGGPAYKAGLRSLDRITEVEGETTQSKDINELTDKLKGKPDTPVKIKVFRRGWTKERDFTLTRAIIAIKTARVQMLEGNIGFLSITSFGDTTSRECADGLAELTKQGMKALVVDLRRNPGGLLRAVVEICDLFLDNDMVVVTTRDRTQTVEEYRTERPDK
ncbi:MAG: PDZ domain-containing protein, partial [Planctomycetes bacterium]|nr:PDZ domain-containing protein [Planctomycetota bacterium]